MDLIEIKELLTKLCGSEIGIFLASPGKFSMSFFGYLSYEGEEKWKIRQILSSNMAVFYTSSVSIVDTKTKVITIQV